MLKLNFSFLFLRFHDGLAHHFSEKHFIMMFFFAHNDVFHCSIFRLLLPQLRHLEAQTRRDKRESA